LSLKHTHFAICEIKNIYIFATVRKHNGMRPQDVAILLKIALQGKAKWKMVTLAEAMEISVSEVSESLNRSRIAGLIDFKKQAVARQNLWEFMVHGVKYVFPAETGALVRGIPTAHSHPQVRDRFSGNLQYVCRDSEGDTFGLAISPFYARQASAMRKDQVFHKVMAMVDLLRIGKLREQKMAMEELEKLILNGKKS
jgi:predicted transcriptional regulator